MVDRPYIERLGYRRAVDLAFQYDSILVTLPSIVTARRILRTVRLGLSIGSLILSPESGIDGPILTRPEWVEGCRVGEERRRGMVRVGGEASKITGRLVAIDLKDPVAMAVNGLKGVFKVLGPINDCLELVHINGIPVIGVSSDGVYCTSLCDEEILGFLEYITTLYTSCYGR